MESVESLKERLKKVTGELSSHKIELHQTKSYLHSILQNSEDLIFVTDVGGYLISFSKGGEKVLGYTWEEVGGMNIMDLVVDPEALERFMSSSKKDINAVRSELPFRHKDGRTVYCDVFLIDLANVKGESVGRMGICRDITMWKNLQEDLVQIDRLAEIGQIASGIAHEINNPLAIINEISGWSAMVVSDAKGLTSEDRTELEKAIERIQQQTRRCAGITHQLLGFARDTLPTRTSLDLHQLLRKAINLLNPRLKSLRTKVVLNFADEPLVVQSDSKMLEQIFINLLTNAIHAMGAKTGSDQGRIELGTSVEGEGVKIVFSDNGTGISDKDKNRIFDLFYTTKSPGKGTGLGLPISRNIARKLGGDIDFHSELGVGTTFTVSIPATQEPEEAPKAQRAPVFVESVTEAPIETLDVPEVVSQVRRVPSEREEPLPEFKVRLKPGWETEKLDETEIEPAPEAVERSFSKNIIAFSCMFLLWVVLSGKFDLFHLSLGVISSMLVTVFFGDLLFSGPREKGLPGLWIRFIKYVPWLVYQVIVANLHVLYLVFHPRMMELIDPEIVRFQSKLKKDISLVTFANSITLTPGTITVSVSADGDFKVHAIDKKSGESLPGEMEVRIARTFGEE
ncbi:MAG: Na+/H+ antiporter subunit E [Pseudomonadota bacterium]